VDGPNIHEPRLERVLRKQGFVLPRASETDRDIPVVRFPQWYSCPQCKRLARHGDFGGPHDTKCPVDLATLVPSRFVVACPKGHIDDFPYFHWVHKGTAPTDDVHYLSISAVGASAALSDIVVSCSCGKGSTMDGAFSRDALREVRWCTGARPWLGDKVECKEIPRTLQRSASNVYFTDPRSAISIPPWSEGVYKIINNWYNVLEHVPDEALYPTINGMLHGKKLEYSVEDLVTAVKQRRGSAGDDGDEESDQLKEQEYQALVHGKREIGRDQDFVCVPAAGDQVGPQWFEQVMLVKKLREVRVLESFTRLHPSTPAEPDRNAPLSRDELPWLPGIEVLGEGIFLRIDGNRLSEWEHHSHIKHRADKVNRRYAQRFAHFGTAPDRLITPRLLLIHTLAHVLINQWSLDCGYPAASLRERLYVDHSMAALLIYTATSDSAGSLGGVVAQGDPDRLMESLREGITNAAWCSADPLCIEADAAGVDSLNLAACHACVLLPEVSCENANTLLDRALLVGTPDLPDLGFFADLISEA